MVPPRTTGPPTTGSDRHGLVIVLTLGAGAGGGLPQWNCDCGNCRASRGGRLPAMTQSSVAVSRDGREWVLLNASPDVRVQLAAAAALHPVGLRQSPLRAVVLTNGDIDHVAGLLSLREKSAFTIHATGATLDILRDNAVFRVLDPALVTEAAIGLEAPFRPVPGLAVTAFAVPGKVALFLEGDRPNLAAVGEQTVGLRIRDGGASFFYVPGCAEIPDWLVARLQEADLLFFDGTVWDDDDMLRTGTGSKTGARMGHVAMSGLDGSLARLAGLRARRVFTHINNTNPALMPGPERASVHAAGWTLAHDGMEITL